MSDKIIVVYSFKREGLTICQHSLEEGSVPIVAQIESFPVTMEFAPAVDPETGIETCYPTMNSKQVFSNMAIIVSGEKLVKDEPFKERKRKLFEGLTVQVNLIHPNLEIRPAREDGKRCEDCELWNREVGVQELEKVTHVYSNGEGQMVKEICEAMSVQYGKPLITKNNVGYCPKHQELSAEKAPGCADLVPKS